MNKKFKSQIPFKKHVFKVIWTCFLCSFMSKSLLHSYLNYSVCRHIRNLYQNLYQLYHRKGLKPEHYIHKYFASYAKFNVVHNLTVPFPYNIILYNNINMMKSITICKKCFTINLILFFCKTSLYEAIYVHQQQYCADKIYSFLKNLEIF